MTKFHLLSEDGGSARIRWSRRKIVGIGIVVFIFIISLIAIIVSTQANIQPVLQSTAQIEDDHSIKLDLARLITEEMHLSAKPCSNFYLYSCGVNSGGFPWVHKRNASVYSFEDMFFSREGGPLFWRRIRALMNESIKANESKAISQVKHLYQACMDYDKFGDLALEPVHQFIQNLGGWPVLGHSNTTANISLEENLASFFIDTIGSNPLYDVDVPIEPNSNYTFKIDNSNPHYDSTGYRFFVSSWDSKDEDSNSSRYEEEFRKIVSNIYSNGEQNRNSSINNEKIDTFVNEIRRYKDFRDNLYANSTAFGESYTGTLGNLTSNHPGFDWVKCLQIYVKYYNGHTITSDTQIYIFSLPIVNAINKYLLTVDSEFLQNLKVWTLLNRFMRSLPTFLMTEISKFAGDIMEEPSRSSPRYLNPSYVPKRYREFKCYWRVNYQTVIRMYSERYVTETSKEWVNEIYTLLKSEFKKNLENTEWLDTGAKSKMIKRLHEMKLYLGHPEHLMNDTWLDAQGYIEDLNVTRDGWLVTKMKDYHHREKIQMETKFTKAEYLRDFKFTGTYYDLTKNFVYVGMKFLQPPVFDEKQPTAYKFGHLSYTMAHEIAHGFDFKSLIDTETPQIQLSNNSINGFKQRNRCILNQYFNYTFRKDERTGDSLKNENMCDTTGLQLAFSTYKKWKQQHELDTDYPGLNNLTSDELFFLGVAQEFCTTGFMFDIIRHIGHGQDSGFSRRVHMMIQNTPGFGEVFQCQRGVSKLYPAENKVCRVYGKNPS